MNTKIKINTEKVFYFGSFLSLGIFVLGLLLTFFTNVNVDTFPDFAFVSLGLPFALWAWLLIFGIFFVKKNWKLASILVALALPHVIFIIIRVFGHGDSFLQLGKWYVMILSFGKLVI